MLIPYVKNKIASRLLVYILVFSGMVTLIITSIQLRIEYQRDIDSIDEQFSRIEKSFKNQIADALWFFNEKALKLHIEGISNLKDIEYLELSGEGKVFINVGEKRSKYVVEKNFPIVYVGENTKRTIGKLKIVASLSKVYSRLINRLIIILISQSIKTFIVAIFIYFLFHFFVIRHLSTIDKYLKSYAVDKASGDLKLRRKTKSSKDELDQVAASINGASKRLKESYETLQQKVEERTRSLQDALNEVKQLSGFLPICSHCKQIRDDKGYWNQIESYISSHSEALFSHGICPDCAKKWYPEFDLYPETK